MFILKKRNIIITAVLILTILTFALCFSSLAGKSAGDASVSKFKIVLDAGHGGVDGGVIGTKTGVKESELNLKVVKKLEEMASATDCTVGELIAVFVEQHVKR